MRKTGLLISVLLVLVFLTASCSQDTDNSLTESSVRISTGETTSAASLTTPAESTSKEVSANTIVTKTDSTTTAPSVPSPSPTPTPKPSAALIPEENLNVILDQITNMEVGTAGASFKSAALSGSVLDWVESSSLSAKDKKMHIDAYLQDLGDAAYVDLFIMNFKSVSDTAQLIINKDDETLGMLLEAGYTRKHTSYTQVKWDEFVSAVQSAADEY